MSNNIIDVPQYVISGLGSNSIIQNNILSNHNFFWSVFSGLTGCDISNNIINTLIGIGSFTNSSVRNNLCTVAVLPGGNGVGNTFAGNIENQAYSSIFVGAPQGSFSYSNDYHLQPTSPGKNGATDGTDIGIYGGQHPWKEGSLPITPHITTSRIDTQNDPSGMLRLRIKIRPQTN